MRKTAIILICMGLVTTGTMAPASAKRKPARAKQPAAVPTTLYLHGTGNDDAHLGVLRMDATEPSQVLPSSKQLPNYAVGPRDDCVNDWLFGPTFQGPISGTVTGDVKVTLYAATTPGSVDIKLLPDFTQFLCGDPKHQAVATQRVELSPTGATEAVFKNVTIPVQGVLSLSVYAVPTPPFVGRLLYDSTNFPAKVEFSCIPARGTSCV